MNVQSAKFHENISANSFGIRNHSFLFSRGLPFWIYIPRKFAYRIYLRVDEASFTFIAWKEQVRELP